MEHSWFFTGGVVLPMVLRGVLQVGPSIGLFIVNTLKGSEKLTEKLRNSSRVD